MLPIPIQYYHGPEHIPAGLLSDLARASFDEDVFDLGDADVDPGEVIGGQSLRAEFHHAAEVGP